MNDQTNIPTTTKSHVQLLADWRAARNTACKYADGSEEEMRYYDLSEEISVQLATLLATTGEDLIAQIT